jgi:hypothetical protein
MTVIMLMVYYEDEIDSFHIKPPYLFVLRTYTLLVLVTNNMSEIYDNRFA